MAVESNCPLGWAVKCALSVSLFCFQNTIAGHCTELCILQLMEVQHGACIKTGNHGTNNRLNNFPFDLLEQMDIWAAATSDLLQDWRESRWREKQKEPQDLLLDPRVLCSSSAKVSSSQNRLLN